MYFNLLLHGDSPYESLAYDYISTQPKTPLGKNGNFVGGKLVEGKDTHCTRPSARLQPVTAEAKDLPFRPELN